LPLEGLAAHGAGVEELARPKASPQLRACLKSLAARTGELLSDATKLPCQVTSVRLAAETAVIVALARKLTSLLLTRDPLSERVHLTKASALAVALHAAGRGIAGGLLRRIRPAATARGGGR